MTIKIELFNEKKIINFYMPSLLLEENSFIVKNSLHNTANNLAGNIMQIDGVQRCLVCSDLVSVQYLQDVQEVRLSVLALLSDYLNDADAFVGNGDEVSDIEALNALADAMIRPTLSRDKGDLEIISLQDGILKIRFLGHCAGCPYAQNTLQNVVAKTLQRFIPQIKQVEME